MHPIKSFFVSAVFLVPFPALASAVDIRFETLQPATDSQALLLSEAEAFWENTLPGYQPGIDIDQVTISVGAFDIDGPSGRLAQAGPRDLVEASGFTLPTAGVVDFDSADLDRLEAEGSLFGLLLHEVAHVLGFGTLWTENDVYVDGSGQYTGRNALSAYQAEFDPLATFVPAELDGAQGTRDAHWDENWAGGPQELMTGFLDSPLFLSETTIASFRDLGYETRASVVPVPLPAGLGLTLSALGMLGLVGMHRRQRTS